MVRSQFASGRSSLDALTVVKETGGSITATKAGTYYFWVQARNDIGYNLASPSSSITIVAGEQIRITLPASLYGTGEGWNSFYISGGTIDSSNTSTLLAVVPVPNGTADLPIDIVLSRDDHLVTNGSVATELLLPTSTDLLNGMVRRIDSTSRIYKYDNASTQTSNNTNIFDGTPSGRWVEFSDGFNIAGIINTTDPTGCDQDISTSIDNSRIETVSYPVDGSIGPISSFWIVNDGSDVIKKGTRVGVSVLVNDVNSSTYFDGFLKLVFRGYSNISTGALDTLGEGSIEPMPNIGSTLTYQSGKSSLILDKDLPVNSAYYLDIYPQFNILQLPSNSSIPYKAVISVYPYIFSSNSLYNEAGQALGDIIYSTEDKRRIVPDDLLLVKALSGSGIVSSYSFNSIGESIVPGILASTSSQNLLIDGNGTVYAGGAPSNLEAIRAVVWTDAVNSTPLSPVSASVSGSSTASFNITIDHPVDPTNTDYAEIRNDYPDVIAGASGFFNPTGIRIYIEDIGTNEIRYFDTGVVNALTQDVTLNWVAGTVIGSIPTPNNDYGFYQPQQITTVTTTSGSQNYQLSFAYTYNGNTVSRISHSTSFGCIYELNDTLAALLEGFIFRASLADISVLKAVIDSKEGEVRLVKSDVTGNYRFFTYDSLSTDTPDDINIIQPTAVTGSGRYIGIGSTSLENIERIDTLTSTYSFIDSSPTYLYVGGTEDEDIIMDVSPIKGRRRLIRNITPTTATYSIKESSGGSTILSLSSDASDSIQVEAIYDGTEWQYTGIS